LVGAGKHENHATGEDLIVDIICRSFLGQAPIFALATIVCWVVLPPLKSMPLVESETKLHQQLRRIDFAGASLLGIGIFSLMLPLEIAGSKLPWGHPIIISLFVLGSILIGFFFVVEHKWVREPIFPTRLLRNRNVVLCYFISGCQLAAQLTVRLPLCYYKAKCLNY
jgi:hypothetical protein